MQNTPSRTVLSVITDFLALDATPEEVIAYTLPDDLQVRTHDLLDHNGESELPIEERNEMFDFMRVGEMIALLKA